MKITREQIKMAIYGADLQNLEQATDAVMIVIDQHEAVYDELVKAIVDQIKIEGSTNFSSAIRKAIQPFLPSPAEQIADELDALADKSDYMHSDLHALAKRVRELK